MSESRIAIVGMAGRFPGARNIDELWRNLCEGLESISQRTDAELQAAGVRREELVASDYVKAAAILQDLELFDAPFFGFSPKDASIMDPQLRHFLECAWEALEHSGHTAENFPGSIGVFAGSGMNSYLIHNLLSNRKLVENAGIFMLKQTGNDKDILATRVSYHLNLRGPSINVQTACSTSLVAVHLACQSLLNHECDMALAGGVTIEIPHGRGYIYREGEILSRDGHCRPFDAASSGTVFSSGLGIVVLRRLEDALRDGDIIHAIILGSAINNDGARKVGYLAPSVDGQAEVIAEALAVAGVPAQTITYVETHGTGTTVGDPIEIKGLTQAFRETTQEIGFCAIGSLKSNLGHLDAAAGVAGLIKTILALKNRKIPASLHFREPNPLIDFLNSPFHVNTQLVDWNASENPRRAGVTSLGIGGTNAHVVLEEAPNYQRANETKHYQLLVVSAKTQTALEHAAVNLGNHLRAHPDLPVTDVAFTCQLGRKPFPYRRAIVIRDLPEAAEILTSRDSRRVLNGIAASPKPSLVFMFSGQGSQYIGMGRELYETELLFRKPFDACASHLIEDLGVDLRDILYQQPEGTTESSKKLNQTWLTQPALFAVEYALAQWWMAHGVRPQAMLGHSIGEYVAACLAGVFSLEDALSVCAARGRLMHSMPRGSMLAVSAATADLELPQNLSLAAVNGPTQSVVAGPSDAVKKFEQSITKRGISCRLLSTSHAFHSSMMDPILDDFTERMRQVTLRSPQIPYLSNVTGSWITAGEATDPSYWSKHLRSTVRFSECLAKLYCDPSRLLLEIGPGEVLTSLARQHPAKNGRVFSSLRHSQSKGSDVHYLLSTLGQLWATGQVVDWHTLHTGETVRRVPLPTYPFEHQRYWVEHSPDSNPSAVTAAQPESLADLRLPFEQWFHHRVWKPSPLPKLLAMELTYWIIFVDRLGVGYEIAKQLKAAGHEVIEIQADNSFKRISQSVYGIRPGVRSDYDAFLADVSRLGKPPKKCLYLWPVMDRVDNVRTDEMLDCSFFGLLFLAQALGDQDLKGIDIAVISNRLFSIGAEQSFGPVRATLLGPAKTIAKELPDLSCRHIDVDCDPTRLPEVARQILGELHIPPAGSSIAYRGSERWTETLEQLTFPPTDHPAKLKQGGVYLITGGLGGIGLVLASYLARTFKAKLVLVGRTEIPPRKEWKSRTETALANDAIASKLRKLLELESLGSEVLAIRADVSNKDEMRQAVNSAFHRFGIVDGVIHAAGIVEDGPLQIKTRESAARVLDPKVRGTLVLEEVFRDVPLDFIVLLSSISSVFPPSGQVDYAAANAFLDTFAANKHRSPWTSINWPLWDGVGMGASPPSFHPLIDRRIAETANDSLHSSQFRSDSHWILGEHCLKSAISLLPGTGYLEMAAAALTRGSFEKVIEFEDVFFLVPFVCNTSETKEARVRLRRDRSKFRFSILSRSTEWVEHASGQIGYCEKEPPRDQSLEAIAARCRLRTLTFDGKKKTKQEFYFDFGPRWQSLKEIRLGTLEGLATLELSPNFSEDVQSYKLHPALLDLATGAALYLIDGYESSEALYLPLSYKRITFYRRLPNKLTSHIRSRRENNSRREIVAFDFTLLDEQGRVLAEIEELSFRRILNPDALSVGSSRIRAVAVPSGIDNAEEPKRQSITPAEGIQALCRILSADQSNGVIVSPTVLNVVTSAIPAAVERESPAASSSGEVETVVLAWWKELLGLEEVGLDDDFFDLGGHSLIGVRLFSKIKKTYRLDLGLSTLFDNRTVHQLASLIRKARTPVHTEADGWSAVVSINSQGSRPPLYLISGLGGNVVNFAALARHLGEDQPVYALQPQGLDGRRAFFTRIEDMASYYLDEIRTMQPAGPYYLAGYSFGGFVAFEMAQQLKEKGAEIGLLGLLDTIEWHYLEQVKKTLRIGERFELYKARLDEALFGDDRIHYLKSRFAKRSVQLLFRGLQAFGRPLPQAVGTIEDVNSFAAEKYKPRRYPGRLDIFRSITRSPLEGSDEFLGWAELAEGGVTVHDIPGKHHDITREPNVRVLAEKLKQSMGSTLVESSR